MFRFVTPLFAKPVHEGTGKGIDTQSKIKTYANSKKRVRYLIKTYKEPVLGRRIPRREEFTVGIVGTPPKVIGTMQIVIDTTRWKISTRTASRRTTNSLFHYVCPPQIEPDRLQEIDRGNGAPRL